MGYLKCCSLFLWLSLVVICSMSHEARATIKLPIHGLQKFHVHIANGLANETLHAHCMSKNDDLGIHDIAPGQEYGWHFKSNFWGTTFFHCNLWWKGGHHAFPAFDDGKKMSKTCGGNDCVYTAKEDGIYIFHNRVDYMFKYSWERLNIYAPPGAEPGVNPGGFGDDKHVEARDQPGVARPGVGGEPRVTPSEVATGENNHVGGGDQHGVAPAPPRVTPSEVATGENKQ